MTLKDLASELHCTPMTIYRRCKRNDIDIKALRGDNGELTAEGCSIIGALFSTTTPGNTDTTADTTDTSTPASHEHNGDTSSDVARLEAELEGARRLIEVLEDQVRDLRSRLDASEAERRQRDQLLLGDGGGLRGWWRRFRRPT